MDCVTYQEQISQFIDGELEMRAQVRLFQHLAVCAACQTMVDGFVRMKEAVRNEHISYPQDLDDAVLGKILSSAPASTNVRGQEQHRERFWNRQIAVPLHLAASFAIIVIAAALMLGRMFLPPSELRQFPASLQLRGAQPQTVVLIYGIPPVEVLGSPTVRTLKGIDQYDNSH